MIRSRARLGTSWSAAPTSYPEIFLKGSSFFDETTQVSLGAVYDTDVDAQDLVASVLSVDGQILSVPVGYVVGSLLGDYNNDNEVNAPDYNVWRDTFGSTTELDADGNLDGIVNAPDYNIWRDRFGSTADDGDGAGASVPEPSGLALVMLSMLLLVRPRR